MQTVGAFWAVEYGPNVEKAGASRNARGFIALAQGGLIVYFCNAARPRRFMNGKILVYTGYVMGVVFIVMGLFTFTAYRGQEGAGGVPTEWFGVLAALYGGFRIWRSWKMQKKWEENKQN